MILRCAYLSRMIATVSNNKDELEAILASICNTNTPLPVYYNPTGGQALSIEEESRLYEHFR